jgi:ornithine carbamoyltransferase
MAVRHFLTLLDLTPAELRGVLQRAGEMKTMLRNGLAHEYLKRKMLAMVFEKSSTRTRVSFETAMTQLGGASIFLSPQDTQLGRGEPIEDTARVLSRMVDAIMVRTFAHSKIETMAKFSSVPVINALTDDHHPCQLLADLQTYVENRGDISGKTVAWIGDGNNMCNSFIHAARQLDFELVVACPEGYDPLPALVKANTKHVRIVRDPKLAVKGAHMVATDVWASMGQEAEKQKREAAFKGYQVTQELMALADSKALFLHCLPAHRGEEVTAGVIDGPQSAVWDEAENRLHVQKGILAWCMA